jgi:thioesterase domain-containing protein
MLVFEQPSMRAVARFLRTSLVAAPDAAPTATTSDGAESIAAIYRRVALRGNMQEVEALLSGAAGLRERFGPQDTTAPDSGVVRLADGDTQPAVLCFPPFAPVEQSLQFARLATWFRGRRTLEMVTVPGFLPGEPLADSVTTLVDRLADAVRRAAHGPVALLGYSSSGWLAHAVTSRLEEDGDGPAALLLLDTYLPDSMPLSLRQAMNYEVNERRARFTTMNFTTLTALGSYRRMFRPWTPAPIAAPTLFLTPEDRIPGNPDEPVTDDDWRARWPLPHTAVRIPGDHCTIVAEHAQAAAAAIDHWLAATVAGSPA